MVTKKFTDCTKNEQWMFCELLGKLDSRNKEQATKFADNYKKDNGGLLTIEFKLNDIEMDFFAVVDEMFRQFDRIVQEEALKKVESTLSKLDDIIHEFQLNINEIKENVRKDVCQNLGLKYEPKEELY